MKLWILRPIDDDPHWEPWYDKVFGFVVRAETEKEARKMAQKKGGDERDHPNTLNPSKRPWLKAEHSTCEELKPDGEEGLIIRDYAAA